MREMLQEELEPCVLRLSSQIVGFEHALKRGDAIFEGQFAFFHSSDEQFIAAGRSVQADDGLIQIVVFVMHAGKALAQGCCGIEYIVVHYDLWQHR
jgi:hypothetical protein